MLPADRLRRIAADLIDLAAEVERMPVERRENWERRRFFEAFAQIAGLVQNGMPETEAILFASDHHHMEIKILREAWLASSARRRSAHRQQQRAVIDAMTAAGYSNADIARTLDVHPKHVPRLRKR
ncbi:hypothetical protein ACM64Y_01815 [Novispirillum sp. DQ9]|uniref:hypothetical protein n=1 Tax=Novispirillum sp. DQ9 TaxID=3398612 RepID=UPI003C7CE602